MGVYRWRCWSTWRPKHRKSKQRIEALEIIASRDIEWCFVDAAGLTLSSGFQLRNWTIFSIPFRSYKGQRVQKEQSEKEEERFLDWWRSVNIDSFNPSCSYPIWPILIDPKKRSYHILRGQWGSKATWKKENVHEESRFRDKAVGLGLPRTQQRQGFKPEKPKRATGFISYLERLRVHRCAATWDFREDSHSLVHLFLNTAFAARMLSCVFYWRSHHHFTKVHNDDNQWGKEWQDWCWTGWKQRTHCAQASKSEGTDR